MNRSRHNGNKSHDLIISKSRLFLLLSLVFISSFSIKTLVSLPFPAIATIDFAVDALELAEIGSQPDSLKESGKAFSEANANFGLINTLILSPWATAFLALGVTQVSFHIIPALLSSFSAIVIYFLVARFFEHKVGITTAFLWALLPLDAYIVSTYATSNLILLTFLLSLMLTLSILDRDVHPPYLFLFVPFLALVAISPFYAIAVVVIFVILRVSRRLNGNDDVKSDIDKAILIFLFLLIVVIVTRPKVLNIALEMYRTFIERRESAVLLPLFMFSITYSLLENKESAKKIVLIALGALWVGIAAEIFTIGKQLIHQNSWGVSLLLISLPLLIFSAKFLTARYESEAVNITVIIFSLLQVFMSILLFFSTEIVQQIILDISRLTQGFAFLMVFVFAFFLYGKRSQIRIFTPLLFGLVAIMVFYPIREGNEDKQRLFREARAALTQISVRKKDAPVYICPIDFGKQIWYLANIEHLLPEPLDMSEIPFLRLPTNAANLEDGIVVVHSPCSRGDQAELLGWELIVRQRYSNQVVSLYQIDSK